jgi:VanZ family protein
MSFKLIKYWLPALLWAALIFCFSTDNFSANHTYSIFETVLNWICPGISEESLERMHFVFRKMGHWSEYFIFALFVFHGIRDGKSQKWNIRWCLGTLFIVLVWALGDELHQWFVPSRTASLKDSLLDFFGGACAMLACYFRFKWQSKRESAA